MRNGQEVLLKPLRQLYFRLRGKDPDAIVVTFATGAPELVAQVFAEIQRLVPERRHVLVEPGATYVELKRRFRKYRIGLAPVLFTDDQQFRPLRRTAFLLAPTRILAYNNRLERHHLRLRTWIASLLFLRGIALDRIFLRPAWLVPWKRDRSVYPTEHLDLAGRELVPGGFQNQRLLSLAPPSTKSRCSGW